MAEPIPQGAVYNRSFLLVLSSDHITGYTGAASNVTVMLSKNGGALAPAQGAVTLIGSGLYSIALTATDTNTIGDLGFAISASTADPSTFIDKVVPSGLAGVPFTGLPTGPPGIIDPTLGQSFLELQCRVAEYLGTNTISGGVVAPPTNAYELNRVNRIVNDGYRRVIAANPRWNFLNVPLSLTFADTPQSGLVTSASTTTFVDSTLAGQYADGYFTGWGCNVIHQDTSVDEVIITGYTGSTGTFTVAGWPCEQPVAADQYQALPTTAASPALYGYTWRYYMPGDFMGIFIDPWVYNQVSPRIELKPIDSVELLRMQAGSHAVGTVSAYAYRPINSNAGTTGGRWEIMFWPMPASINTITARYKRFPQALVNATDRSICGFQHDDLVIKACLAEAELQVNDKQAERFAAYSDALQKAIAEDARSNPGIGLDYGDRSEDRFRSRGRLSTFADCDTYNGVNIPQPF
jgi:hypothetical protein